MKAKIRGFEMAYDDTGGSAIPLLLIHAFPFDRTMWAAQLRELADAARVVAPDLRGFGESGFPGGAVTMDTYADDLIALLDALSIKNAVVAGLSMGGYVAFAFFRKYQPRARGLILANTKAGPDTPEGKKARDDNAALARSQSAAAVGAKMMPNMLTPKTAEERSELASSVRATMGRQSVEGVVAALLAMRDRPDSTPTLAQITVPTLILSGAEDTLIPPKEAELMRDGIPGARLVSIPGAAHLENVEQPDAFNAAVRAFLKSIA